MRRVAIVGGGLSGLAAAWQVAKLARDGAEVEAVLFEASGRLGGLVETVREGGFTVECGPDAWVTAKPAASELASELGLAGELIPSNDAGRETHILLDGRLVPMPRGMQMMVPTDLEALDGSAIFSAKAKAAFHAEIGRAEELKAAVPDGDESVAEFVLRHFGAEVLEKIAAPLLSGGPWWRRTAAQRAGGYAGFRGFGAAVWIADRRFSRDICQKTAGGTATGDLYNLADGAGYAGGPDGGGDSGGLAAAGSGGDGGGAGWGGVEGFG